MKLYHLTTSKNATKILTTGLKPKKGTRSKIIDDKRMGIFLCEYKDIPYWQIILGLPVILEVQVPVTEDMRYEYSYASEYVYESFIPASDIKVSKITVTQTARNKAMKKICIESLHSLSQLCENCVNFYYESLDEETVIIASVGTVDYVEQSYTEELYESIVAETNSLSFYLPHLDYSVVPQKRLVSELKKMANNGAFTICDEYYNTGKRLYQLLLDYKDELLAKKFKRIHQCMVKSLKECLDTETGGYC